MAVIAPSTGSNLNNWCTVIGIGLALTIPPIMSANLSSLSSLMPTMVTDGFQIGATVTLAAPNLVSSSSQSVLQADAQTVYEVPHNLGLPNRREPGGTR